MRFEIQILQKARFVVGPCRASVVVNYLSQRLAKGYEVERHAVVRITTAVLHGYVIISHSVFCCRHLKTGARGKKVSIFHSSHIG